MKKTLKLLNLLLLLDAGFVLALQIARTPFAWVFVALYWAILTAKNYIGWKLERRKK